MKCVLGVVVAMVLVMTVSGCQSRPEEAGTKDYDRPLPPGEAALRKLPPSQWPDLSVPFAHRDLALVEAAKRSVRWFGYPSTKRHFPIAGVTHEAANASAFAFLEVLTSADMPSVSRLEWLKREFDLYMSVGCDDRGTVLFTGYYSPIFTASRVRTARYRYPLYRQPEQLVKPDQPGGQVRWRGPGGALQPPPTRRELEQSGVLRGHELVFLADPLDAYIIQVQGSARLQMTDGTVMDIGYAADNGHEYTSIGQELIEAGVLDRHSAGLASIRAYFASRPDQLDEYVNRNDRFIFMKAYDRSSWPAGSLGFQVAPWRSLATDKSVFPRALPVLVDTMVPSPFGDPRPFKQLMFDQDTGGAIRAPGRADIYMGIGASAERVAGRQKYEGQLYYFLLKPERVSFWLGRMKSE